MSSMLRIVVALAASAALALTSSSLVAQPKEKDKDKGGGGKDRQEQRDQKGSDKDKQQKPKKAKHNNGKSLVGDKIKKNGKHELHKNGKHTAFVDVQDGKIRGVNVKHAEKGDVPVKKYKTNKKMADASTNGIQPVNLILAQAYSGGTTWIGYAYIDEWGDEVIYWFEYELIYDGDTGAVEYVPVY
jgi:hypothetical protein